MTRRMMGDQTVDQAPVRQVARGLAAFTHGSSSAGRRPGDIIARRRISGPRRRLHRLPHRAGRHAVRRRPCHADAVRHALHLEHHARPRDRHRQVDRRPVLQDDAHGPFPGRRPALSGDAVCLLHQGHARQDSDAIFAYLRSIPPVQQPNRPHDSAFPLQQPLADPRLAHAVLQRGRVQAGSEAIGRMESRRLSGRGPRPLRHVPHRRSTRSAAARNRRRSRAA